MKLLLSTIWMVGYMSLAFIAQAQVLGEPFVDTRALVLKRIDVSGQILVRINDQGYLQMVFLNDQGKVLEPPYVEADVRYRFANAKDHGQDFSLPLALDPAGSSLVSSRVVSPPNLWLWIGLGKTNPSSINRNNENNAFDEERLTSKQNYREYYYHVRLQY